MKYLWYSGATDVTGQTLAERLSVDSGRNKPRDADIVIGWGCKTKENTTFPANTKVLNHPNAILKNRNKQETLNILKGNRATASNVATHVAANAVIDSISRGDVTLPLIGRTRMHQGGKGFWLCLTESMVRSAIEEGAHYFQEYIDIKQEYRLHVFCGDVIYAQKKVENPSEEGWIAQRKEKIENWANKKGDNLDDATLTYVLRRLAKEADLPDRIVRSNRRGWKFSSVQVNNVDTALKNAAVAAVAAIGLDFGAVDCALGQDNSPWIIEVNSGPGLQGSSLEAYVTAFQSKIRDLERANRPEPVAAQAAPRRRGARRDARGRFIAVGAEAAQPNEEAPAAERAGLARIMQNVRNDDEARAVIDALMRGDL